MLPVCPICHSTSACRIWATWRGMARSRRLLEWRPVACQKPEPSDRLVLLNGRDDCHDCVPRVALQGAEGSDAAEAEDTALGLKSASSNIPVIQPVFNLLFIDVPTRTAVYPTTPPEHEDNGRQLRQDFIRSSYLILGVKHSCSISVSVLIAVLQKHKHSGKKECEV